MVAAELHQDLSSFLSGAGQTPPARWASITRVRWAAVAYLMLGVALATIAIGCTTGTITHLVDALPGEAAVHVAHPVRYGFMYMWFAALSFLASWFSATQARLPR